MSGGSVEEETSDDRQCKHCGLWYSGAGLSQHEQHCDYRGSEHRLRDLEDPFALSRVSDETNLVG